MTERTHETLPMLLLRPLPLLAAAALTAALIAIPMELDPLSGLPAIGAAQATEKGGNEEDKDHDEDENENKGKGNGKDKNKDQGQ